MGRPRLNDTIDNDGLISINNKLTKPLVFHYGPNGQQKQVAFIPGVTWVKKSIWEDICEKREEEIEFYSGDLYCIESARAIKVGKKLVADVNNMNSKDVDDYIAGISDNEEAEKVAEIAEKEVVKAKAKKQKKKLEEIDKKASKNQ